jgi:FkbM family methyltransferase
MNRGSPEYIEAVQRVKIDYFTEHLGLDIKGILHVGTNDGYEMQFYRSMGIEHLAGVDPLPSAIGLFREHYPDIPLFEYALSDVPGRAMLNVVTPGDGQGSSLLVECRPNPDYNYNSQVEVEVRRGDSLPIAWENFDCMVVDVQGLELPVLVGFGDALRGFRMLNIECSIEPVYEGGARAADVDSYLASMGFVRKSDFEIHNDVFWVREDVQCLNH